MGDFDLFKTNEEHEELRAAVRSVAAGPEALPMGMAR